MFKFCVRKLFAPTNFVRCSSSACSTPLAIENVAQRGLLRVSGPDTSTFLQGLTTNDMRHLEGGVTSMYTMFLNTKGRVLCDVLVYKSQEKEAYYLECDLRAITALRSHLKLYRVRRKIDIDDVADATKVWSIFDPRVQKNETVRIVHRSPSLFPNSIGVYPDPRLPALGYRVLSDANAKPKDVMEFVGCDILETNETLGYKALRYRLGVGEGSDEIPSNKAFPLECNCDYLNGVSFLKGCYIGQELTARTHHTGVVRKRLMPVIFEASPLQGLELDADLRNESDKSVGKFRGQESNYGLALMRITEAMQASSVHVSDVSCRVIKPWWWPSELSNETVTV